MLTSRKNFSAYCFPLLSHCNQLQLQHPTIAKHPGERLMLDMLRREFIWLHKAAVLEHIIGICQSCVQTNLTYRQKCKCQWFSAVGPLEFITKDTLGSFPKITQHNHNILFITDCYPDIAHTIPTFKSTATQIAKPFFDKYLVLYGILTYPLTDTSVQLNSKFFAAICTLHGVPYLTTTAYYTQTSVQAKRYNKTSCFPVDIISQDDKNIGTPSYRG